jgi:hypothetical protein
MDTLNYDQTYNNHDFSPKQTDLFNTLISKINELEQRIEILENAN